MGIKPADALEQELKRIDGKGYKAYKDIAGEYDFKHFILFIDYVQGDPFASPSRVRVRVARRNSGFPQDTTANKSRTVALADFLTRRFFRQSKTVAKGGRGTGKGGMITIDNPGQQILERSSFLINDDFVEARCFVGLPAFGRKIAGRDATAMFFSELPEIVHSSMFFSELDQQALYRHIKTAEDADAARSTLSEKELIAFIADQSLLPRRSGIDDRPLDDPQAVLFYSDKAFRVTLDLPNNGPTPGMGIPRGVTLIAGGGYHGKSTLLHALERGVYNHVPDDGRHLAVTAKNAIKIRACDGRNIEKTDISSFISNLPMHKDTSAFSTQNASGSTSQAANIIEAVEAGAQAILLDEDTSATNFMIRDHRMQQLVAKEREPITPFIDKVRQLYSEKGVSTVLVMGGSGDYFNVADRVIRMTEYLPEDATEAAKAIAGADPVGRREEGGTGFGRIAKRIPIEQSISPYRRNQKMKISARGLREILFGETEIDLTDIEQIVDPSQTRAVAHAIYHAARYMKDGMCLQELTEKVIADIKEKGIDVLTPHVTGDLAEIRSVDLAGALNRMRTLQVRQG
ncbi:MAG: ABC-ATPase domain-containing protein [Desulfobacteraceae bacterium]|nr:ABC-ATPase domain-containing protein [Desulfobacteraceae bacterium]MCF8094228.1 ABC-ATPase domain-containing protein [Desulfobacteraceae bacterium]